MSNGSNVNMRLSTLEGLFGHRELHFHKLTKNARKTASNSPHPLVPLVFQRVEEREAMKEDIKGKRKLHNLLKPPSCCLTRKNVT
jgi:hypothetical protein